MNYSELLFNEYRKGLQMTKPEKYNIVSEPEKNRVYLQADGDLTTASFDSSTGKGRRYFRDLNAAMLFAGQLIAQDFGMEAKAQGVILTARVELVHDRLIKKAGEAIRKIIPFRR